MKAILLKEPGGPEMLTLGEHRPPQPAGNEILVKVHATALNRADILQREGKYPPPAGESEILGLEMAGEVVESGLEVEKWKPGNRVCGLLAGGGYAEYAVIHEDMALPIPDNLSFEEATAIPEVFLTAFQALHSLAHLQAREKVLIHSGASGVGTAAIQIAKMSDATVFVTASASKHDLCRELGASFAVDYHTRDFEKEILQQTYSQGVNVILDFVGAPYLQKNLNLLSMDGRLVMLSMMGGIHTDDLQISNILRKRLQIIGSTLRNRSLEYKIALTRDFRLFAWDAFAIGKLKPVIDTIFDWQEVAEAHRYMESNQSKGKIILKVN
ncbi:MAG: NAD(P)H-quinone oxidoreductase [Saprospiraceae bacterium]|nr:NAD(P)H-quinone oxidoreductase [Saprospiraceae bacterium]